MLKVLVLGHKGQLGQSLIKEKPKNINLFFPKSRADVSNFEILRATIDDCSPDYIVNCAAYTAVDKAEDNFRDALETNAYGPANLGVLCKERNIGLVHISTDYVFSGEQLAVEKEDKNPLNVYGYTKALGEDLVKGVYPDVTIIRTASVYSEFGNNFLKSLLGRYHSGQKEFDVVCDQMSCPTYAPDLAKAIFQVINDNVKGEILHYAGKLLLSWDKFAKEIFKEVDPTVKINPVLVSQYNARAARPAISCLITSQCFTPSSVEEGVSETLKTLLNKEFK